MPPTCSRCGRPMEYCDNENPAHVAHDAESPHWAALHLHGGRPEPDENGLIFLGVGEYTKVLDE